MYTSLLLYAQHFHYLYNFRFHCQLHYVYHYRHHMQHIPRSSAVTAAAIVCRVQQHATDSFIYTSSNQRSSIRKSSNKSLMFVACLTTESTYCLRVRKELVCTPRLNLANQPRDTHLIDTYLHVPVTQSYRHSSVHFAPARCLLWRQAAGFCTTSRSVGHFGEVIWSD